LEAGAGELDVLREAAADPALFGAEPAGEVDPWDEDTRELIAEFVDETMESLERSAALLADVGDGVDRGGVDELFRAFHSIKGVAGFMDLEEIVRLAHATEDALSKARAAAIRLEGAMLSQVAQATVVMQRMVAGAGDAAARGVPLSPTPDLPALVEALRAPDAAPRSAPPVSAPSVSAPAHRRRTIRVERERVVAVQGLVGELGAAEDALRDAAHADTLTAPLDTLRQVIVALETASQGLHSVSLRQVFSKLPRVVEDAARRAGKAVELRLDGDHLQIPREVAAALGDPLVHMLRNAVDHGVEAPEERRGAGKPSAATVQISARQEGGALIVEIGDDGRGLNRAAILRRARERGLLDAGEAPDEATLFGLIFAPGFSTAQAVTDLSGRGVGMDVVRTSVESVGGHIEVESRPGRGSTFRILVPTA